MLTDIFISYSRKNLVPVTELYEKLNSLGYKIWFDKVNLLVGQNFETEIKKAINDTQTVLLCLSSKWINDKSYVQKELKWALKTMEELPQGQIFIIPIKLDECEIPKRLNKIHTLNIYENNGFKKLIESLDYKLKVSRNEIIDIELVKNNRNDLDDIFEFLITQGTIIYEDPFLGHSNEEEKEFKNLLKGRLSYSSDLLEQKKYESIIDLWEPLNNNEYFRVDNEYWVDKPYFRSQIHSAKSQLFISYIQLSQQGKFEDYVPKAMHHLNELLCGNPYSMKGASADRLEKKDALILNLNYIDTLSFANSWFKGWSDDILYSLFKIPITQTQDLIKKVNQRISEINYLINNQN